MLMTQIARENIVLPDLDLIKVAPIREAVIYALAAQEERTKAFAEFGSADDALRELQESERTRHAEILASDPTAEIDVDELEKAERARRVAQARAQALEVVVAKAVAALHATIDTHSGTWAKKAATATSKAIADLASAIRVADEARERLYASVGVLGLLRAFPETGSIAIRHAAHGYTFSIDSGVEALREAMRSAGDELASHSIALGLVKPAREPEAAETADDAPTATTAPAPAVIRAEPATRPTDEFVIVAEVDHD